MDEETELPTFADLLDRHLSYGTRPSASPEVAGRVWTTKEFAGAFKKTVGERLVRYWRQGRYTPTDLAAVEEVLFGDNQAWQADRLILRKAYARAKSADTKETLPFLISWSREGQWDLSNAGAREEDIVAYFADEYRRHPRIFSEVFSSLPFSYKQITVIASLDENTLLIERIVKRHGMPSSELWASALSQYRIACALPYRKRASPSLDPGFGAVVRHYERLVGTLERYLASYDFSNGSVTETSQLRDLHNEAEHFRDLGQHARLISTLELLLSHSHKLLLECVPHPPTRIYSPDMNTRPDEARIIRQDAKTMGAKIILIVEDEGLVAMLIEDMISDTGFNVRTIIAQTTAAAFTHLVNEDIDLLWADINMGGIPSTDVILAMHKCSPDTKIVICSGYGEAGIDERIRKLAHGFYQKPIRDDAIRTILMETLG